MEESYKLFTEYLLTLEDYYNYSKSYALDERIFGNVLSRARTFLKWLRKIDSTFPNIEKGLIFERGEFLVKGDDRLKLERYYKKSKQGIFDG